ncbi:MAG TPA: hypothetical protein VGK88_09870 [bacterium]|jgi:hypothetical protein
MISRAVVLYLVIAAVVAGGIYAWDAATRPSAVTNPNDPAVRAKAAAQTITGEPTVRRVIVDNPGVVTVEANSKYYKGDASPAANRQYLSTEGRLIVQLILHDMPEMVVARVVLFSGRTRLATIEGRTNQTYEAFRVTYEGPLTR